MTVDDSFASNQINDKIRNWLSEENLQFNRIEDPSNNMNISFWPNPNMPIHAIIRNDRLSLIIRALFSQEGGIVYSSKTQEKQKEFRRDLNLALRQISNVDFSFYLNPEKMQGVQISKMIFSESLTKTVFFDTILAVTRAAYVFSIKEEQLVETGSVY
jgi:hypothetical protein